MSIFHSIPLGVVSGSSSWTLRNFNVVLINPDGVDLQTAHITWTADARYETEIWRSLDGGAFALLTTVAPNVGEYDDELMDGDEHTVEYYARFKNDTTVLNVPTGLTLTEIAGGVRISGNVNNTEAEFIDISANIAGAGHSIITSVAVTGATFTYDHTVSSGQTIVYKVRAKEGTLPVYSDYTAEESITLQITDLDGNIYTTTVIAGLTVIKENFRTTKFLNGDTIPLKTTAAALYTDSVGCMAWYNNDSATYKDGYGALYNSYALHHASGFGLTGFHVATAAEMDAIIANQGGLSNAEPELKESGTTHWNTANGNNSSGFTAVGGGRADAFGFRTLKVGGFYMTKGVSPAGGTNYYINDGLSGIFKTPIDDHGGYSVRLIKD